MKILYKKNIIDCYFKNLNQFILTRKARFFFDSEISLYYIKHGDFKFYFSEKKRGFKHYKKGLDKRGLEIAESYGINLIDWQNTDIAIDCGANVGDLSIFLKAKIMEKNYFAFEPSERDFDALSLNAPNSICAKVGLSDTEGENIFYLSTEKGDSSLIKPRKFTEKTIIKTNTLDNIFELHKFDRVKLLKLEAEGHEPEILDGASQSINKIDYIAVDGGYERGVSQDETLSIILNKLIPIGFYIIFINLKFGRALLKSRNALSS